MKLYDLIQTENGFQLKKTHFVEMGQVFELSEPQPLKEWDRIPNVVELSREIELNDWNRWRHSLYPGQRVEVSETVYDHMLECLPPRNWKGDYFEVGEPSHHDTNGRAIHRAFWKEGDRFFTGYPKQ